MTKVGIKKDKEYLGQIGIRGLQNGTRRDILDGTGILICLWGVCICILYMPIQTKKVCHKEE